MICGREIKARISSLRALICGFKSGEGISLSKNKNKLEVRFTKVKQSLTRILFFLYVFGSVPSVIWCVKGIHGV